MSNTIQKKNREECLKNYINEILINKEIDCGEEWWLDANAQKELEKLANTQENYITDSGKMNIGGEELLIFAVYKKHEEVFVNKIEEKIASLSSSKTLKIPLIFFVNNMKSRVFLEKRFKGNVVCILFREYEPQEIKLTDLNRYAIVQEPPISGKINLEKQISQDEQNNIIRGLVCTVDLFQMVELYNILGDQVFKYNVRIGMKETLGVDSAIRQTLEKEPENFWFKNNGITILIENPDFNTNNAEKIVLDYIKPGRELRFSIVNGAQTINTAAQYFYELEYQLKDNNILDKKDITEKLNRSKKANVLLRIMHISAIDDTQQAFAMAKEISVALNRQKPIKIEDIAFTTPFVEKLTNYLDVNSAKRDDLFQLVRRGEKTDKYRQMDLVEFSRARLACAGYPGRARSQSANKLLEYQSEDGKNIFTNKIIFVESWMKAVDSEKEKIFQQEYKAVWYAHRIALEYEEIRRKLQESESDIQNVIQNGKWYFTAFLINILNSSEDYAQERNRETLSEEKFPDFTNFTCDLKEILNNILQAMECFAEIIITYINDNENGESKKYGEINTNLFKTDKLYKDIIQELGSINEIDTKNTSQNTIMVMYRHFLSLIQQGSEVLPESSAEVSGDQSIIVEKCVILNGKRILVQSDAQALELIAEYVLETFPLNKEQLNEMKKWITDDKRIALDKQFYFQGAPRHIYVNEKEYWVGTHSNTKVKCSQIKQLCELAKVPKRYIFWYKSSQEKPEFSW